MAQERWAASQKALGTDLESALAVSCERIERALCLAQSQPGARGHITNGHAAAQALNCILHSLAHLPGYPQAL